jgi:cyclohexanone monooxygenase
MPYVGGVGNYRKKCDEIADNGYEGFILDTGSCGQATLAT